VRGVTVDQVGVAFTRTYSLRFPRQCVNNPTVIRAKGSLDLGQYYVSYSHDETPYSPSVAYGMPAPVAPSTPRAVAASPAEPGRALLVWSAPESGEVTGYRVSRNGPDGGWTEDIKPENLQYKFWELQTRTYELSVQALGVGGTSSPVAKVTVAAFGVTPSTTEPTPPDDPADPTARRHLCGEPQPVR
jgi:hypothetical protein